jgi:hypothetical protein
MNSPETNLVAIDALKPVDVFKPGGVEKLLADLEMKVRDLNKAIDPASEKGRDAAKSLAYKIARSKTGLDDMGKEFVAKLKVEAAKVDADRRTLRDRCDALRDEVRKPVDDWEAAEEARINDHVIALNNLQALGQFLPGSEPTVAEIDQVIAAIAPFWQRDWQEFKERADQLLVKIPAALATLRAATVKREAERAELERLRQEAADRLAAEQAEKAAREQRERDERIAREAAEKAQEAAAKAAREAEERAAAEQRRIEQERAAAIARAEKAEADAKAAAEKAEADKKAAAERAEAERKAAAAKAEADAKAAAERAEVERKAAAEQAVRDRQAAIEAERQRVAAEKAAEDAATASRERDRNHRATVNKAARADLMQACKLTEEQATAVVKAIASGDISNTRISY